MVINTQEDVMSNYVIFTDSGCDLPLSLTEQWDVKRLSLTFHFEQEGTEYGDGDVQPAAFYDRMKAGEVAKTAAINMDTFKNAFEEYLKQGMDVLYIGFSSGLSATYHASTLAAEELMEAYPDRRVVTVDTLAASAGQGMLVWLAVEAKKKGGSIDEVAQVVEGHKMNLAHWFTVDDLEYLKRGGRVSPAVAFVGGLLGIKPVLHVDNEGHLIKKGTVRGRKAALKELVNKYMELACTPGAAPIYICNAVCPDDVETLKGMLKEACGAEVDLVVDIGPVIGAHAGPGTIAVFFLGKER